MEENKQIDQAVPEVETETLDSIPKAEYDKVLKESITRKKKLRELEAQIEELKSSSANVEKKDLEVNQYKKLLAEKEETIQSLNYLGRIRDEVTKLGAIDSRIAELVFADAKREDALDDSLSNFISNWKKQNTTLFAPEKPVSSTPTIPKTTSVQAPTVSATDEDKWKGFQGMTKVERASLSRAQFDELLEIGRKIAGNSFRPAL